jgi:hypothetical protein
MKTKKELLKFLKDELQTAAKELDLTGKKITDFRKVKKNDMYYGQMVDRVHLLGNVIKWIKDLEGIK